MPLLMEEHLNSGSTEPIAVATPHRLVGTVATPGGLSLLKDCIVAKYVLRWTLLDIRN